MQLNVFIVLLVLSVSTICLASDEDDLAEYHKSLNQEVMSQEFFAEQPEKVEAYIAESMKKDLKPPEYTGKNWRAGYTCRNLLAYSWYEYRNCRYYHRYYGYYYPYP